MSDTTNQEPRRRLPRAERRAQLLDTARSIVRSDGTDALTLATLADRAGISKPVVYDHFSDREGLLAALYRAFDDRQHEALDRTAARIDGRLDHAADVIAEAYIGCAMAEGVELPGVFAALRGTPALEALRTSVRASFADRCAGILRPHAPDGELTAGTMTAVLGAAAGLSDAAVAGTLDPEVARGTLARLIVALVSDEG